MQLKLQYRATQAAQVAERKASDSKKRFVSYIFHEVRVPLNTALLAVQNLQGEHFFEKCADAQQREMADGLMGSLTMMEKVLNDVLSFNRMESGKFTQARKPFDFHKSVQLVVLSHRSQAIAADLQLTAEMDPAVDKLGGIFIGDEMRIRQVMSNLVSNAIKFTPSGSVKIVTKLLYPRLESSNLSESPMVEKIENETMDQAEDEDPETTKNVLLMQNHSGQPTPLSSESLKKLPSVEKPGRFTPGYAGVPPRPTNDNKAILRVEVHDTGVGLNRKDVIDSRLFSAYVQTEIGRRQGGKGSGLGLALCLQIVKSLKGRLGVDSQVGEGSMFWFELALTLPPPGSKPLGTSMPPLPRSPSHPGPGLRPSDYAYDRGDPRRHSDDPLNRPEHIHRPPSQRPLLTSGSQSPGIQSMYSPMLSMPVVTQAEDVMDVIDDQVHRTMQEELPHPMITFPPRSDAYDDSETSSTRNNPEAFAIVPKSKNAFAVPNPPPSLSSHQPGYEEKLHCLVVDDDK